jgi:PRTRC genetic system protein B
MPEQVLHISTGKGCAIWYTPACEVSLLFKKELAIPSGTACVPPLVWKADRERLHLYALRTDRRPSLRTALYHAPFFNLHGSGLVCMGTVAIDISSSCTLEDFMVQWQHYFYDSYFSHLIQEHNPVGCNIVQLWQEQVATDRKFPTDVLIKSPHTLNDLIR